MELKDVPSLHFPRFSQINQVNHPTKPGGKVFATFNKN